MAIDGNGNKVVQAKVLQVAYTTSEWAEAATAAKVISRGQIVAELTTNGKTKLKMGDGVNTFANLPYVTGDVEVDNTLSVQGQAADAKATGDAISELENTDTTISLTGDVVASAETFKLGDIIALTTTVQSVAANKITGVLALENIPQGALERCVVVADLAAMLALTDSSVQNGDVVKLNSAITATVTVADNTALLALTSSDVNENDVVKVTSTGTLYIVSDVDALGTMDAFTALEPATMFFVKDETKLGSIDAFEPFSTGIASAVEWTNVLNKPAMDSTLSQVGAIAEANAVGLALANKVDVVTGKQLSTEDFTTAEKTKLANLTDNDPATALVVTGIKQSSSSVTVDKGDVVVDKSYVGLGNVTNKAQVKGLASGTTAGNVVAWGADGYTVADSGVAAANVVVDTDTLILNCTL